MTPDTAVFAQQLTTYLTPLLPLLLKAGEPVAEAAGDRTVAVARAIWARLHPKLQASDPFAETTVLHVAEGRSAAASIALREQIRQVLLDDRPLARDLAEMLAEVQPHNPQVNQESNVFNAPANITGDVVTGGQRKYIGTRPDDAEDP